MSVIWCRCSGETLIKDFPTKDTLENMSWADIRRVCKAGKALEYWTIGEQKTITVNNIKYTVDLIGFDHDTPIDVAMYGRQKAGATFQLHKLLLNPYPMNDTSTNVGGWKSSIMRTKTMATLLGQLNFDLRNVIVPVKKLSGIGGGSTSGTETTSDSLFLLSEVEIYGTRTNSIPDEGSQYRYYSNGGSKIKDLDISAASWWMRSPASNNSSYFCKINSSGKNGTDFARSTYGVSFGFCV